jgi:hypothetical protein
MRAFIVQQIHAARAFLVWNQPESGLIVEREEPQNLYVGCHIPPFSLSAKPSRSSRNFRFDLLKALVKAFCVRLLSLKCHRKTSAPFVQKFKLLVGCHNFPSRVSHDVTLLTLPKG